MTPPEQVIAQTKKWITDVVIGQNFCPFAAREVKRNTVYYHIDNTTEIQAALDSFLHECVRLDNDRTVETALLIFPEGFDDFDDYLNLLSRAEKLLTKKGYEGIYQVASFHPEYIFEGSLFNDAANYTNRSPYPMLHLLREESIEKALENYPDPKQIPERNIAFARQKGLAYMKMLRDACM